MKLADVVGFAAVGGAGLYTGYKWSQGTSWQLLDFLTLAVLLVIGFYFAVVIS